MIARRFRATLEGAQDSAATYVLVPPSVMKVFKGRTRVPVRAAVNGIAWRTTIANMGAGPMVGVTAATRQAAGIERGDRITLSIELDTEERRANVPADFSTAMTGAQRAAYDAMSYSHRREYVQWIEAAKKPGTRLRRIEKACAKLDEGSRGK
ncbi:MAG: DUF1905 domain-containing protein [Candidatus Eremiobacteraeota bacterium]|nr:DUF1905 domain-containing protein [Candidatus Eremiobacteraeota bacterium]